MSLRARLLAGLLALAAAGLLLLGGITYAEQRSFLEQRADQQARAAVFPLAHQLADRNVDPDHDGRGGGGPPPDVNLPPGTYGEARDATGAVLGRTALTYGEKVPRP